MTAIVAPPGSAPGEIPDLYFEWVTPSASNEWDIVHGLGFKPSGIVVIDSGGTTMYGFEIEHVSVNRVILRFNAAFNGRAYLS